MKRLIIVVLIISNFITQLWGGRVIPIPDHLKPFRIRIQGEFAVIAEGPEIFIYRLEKETGLKLLHRFGKAGEGPREFKLFPEESPELDLHPDTIVATSINKVSFYNFKGEYQGETRIKGGRRQFYRKMGEHLIGEYQTRYDNQTYVAIGLFDMVGNKIKELFRYLYHAQRGKQYNPIGRGIYTPNVFVYKNAIYIGGQLYANSIHVTDVDGKNVATIKAAPGKIKFTDRDKQGWIDSFMLNDEYKKIYAVMKKRFKYPEYFPYWQTFIVADDRIYVQTYERNKEDTSNRFHIMTLKGGVLGRIWLPLDEFFDFTPCPYTIHNGKLYQFVENDESEEWELHITDIKL